MSEVIAHLLVLTENRFVIVVPTVKVVVFYRHLLEGRQVIHTDNVQSVKLQLQF